MPLPLFLATPLVNYGTYLAVFLFCEISTISSKVISELLTSPSTRDNAVNGWMAQYESNSSLGECLSWPDEKVQLCYTPQPKL